MVYHSDHKGTSGWYVAHGKESLRQILNPWVPECMGRFNTVPKNEDSHSCACA